MRPTIGLAGFVAAMPVSVLSTLTASTTPSSTHPDSATAAANFSRSCAAGRVASIATTLPI